MSNVTEHSLKLNGKRRTPATVWLRVRKEYQQGLGSCAELARRHGLSAGAVSSRCKRQRWRLAVAKLDQKLDEQLDQLTKAKAETLTERAARMRERMLDESESWLDKIQQAKALVAVDDTEALKQLIAAWQIPVAVGTKLLRLDETPVERPLVVIGLMDELREANSRTPAQEEAPPLDVAATVTRE